MSTVLIFYLLPCVGGIHRHADDKMYSVFNIHIILHFILNLLYINEPKYVKQINHFTKQDKL